MPPITRWFIKAGIFWFITGMILAFLAELPVLSTVRCSFPFTGICWSSGGLLRLLSAFLSGCFREKSGIAEKSSPILQSLHLGC